ncbi:hypothetical protein BC826DRAFT_1183847 [Russula brevipes]|nr:hypothetical protein BC826DRAFT_1183847 [Russula brevipes]
MTRVLLLGKEGKNSGSNQSLRLLGNRKKMPTSSLLSNRSNWVNDSADSTPLPSISMNNACYSLHLRSAVSRPTSCSDFHTNRAKPPAPTLTVTPVQLYATNRGGFVAASRKRDADFHELFKTIPEGDYLIEDYTCAFQREIVVRGHIYISKTHVCFYTDILDRVTELIIPFSDIFLLEETMTAFAILNAIQITTRTAKHTFAFVSCPLRNAAFEMIFNVWRLACPGGTVSIDEDMRCSALDNPLTPTSIGHVSASIHKATSCACRKEGRHYSELLVDTVLLGTPESIYKLMFASKFLKDFMRENQELQNIRMSNWEPAHGALNYLKRKRTFVKPLRGINGLKCVVHDGTVHGDLGDYIATVTTMLIPDAPSGSAFYVTTLTCITWASSASSRVVVTSQVEWTGRSAMKQFIEKCVLDGQRTYHGELEHAMKSYIQEHQKEFILTALNPATKSDGAAHKMHKGPKRYYDRQHEKGHEKRHEEVRKQGCKHERDNYWRKKETGSVKA